MRAGLLWFDDSPKVPLATKVDHAVRRYREKFGKAPDICYVHPRTLAEGNTDATPVRVVELRSIQPNHFWVGLVRPAVASGRTLPVGGQSRLRRERRPARP